ncbi:MAG TPA: 3-phosphoshikimate 1-carboxyvinyltransferase [Tenuifilaceae bacterium]|nr:3-phosphoshikimate 1-carboxyvinyltransferase [Tenuifilaceae bacterium]
MKKLVRPSKISGTVVAPPSKSVAQRAIALASMAKGQSEIYNIGNSSDCLAAIGICKSLGTFVEGDGSKLIINGGIKAPKEPLNCGESGFGARVFSSIVATLKSEVVLTGEGSLQSRPMQMVSDALVQLGATCVTNSGFLPIKVKGPIQGGNVIVDGSVSSQVLSGLLMAAPLSEASVKITVRNLKSIPYVLLTIDMMKTFGVSVENVNNMEFCVRVPQQYSPVKYDVEGDWSSAAFMLVAGAIAGEVEVKNLNPDSYQADREIVKALQLAGAQVLVKDNSVLISKDRLVGFNFDATHCPDLFPPLVALASQCVGESKITGTSRLQAKESNRTAALVKEFGKMGVEISVQNDSMFIRGGKINAASVDSHNDHRIAMACAIAAINADAPIFIENADVVTKSFPDFFEQLNQIQC